VIVKALPANGVKLASTHDVEFAAYKIEGETTMQFNTTRSFPFYGWIKKWKTFSKIAVPQNFTPGAFVEEMVAELKEKLQDDKVVLGLSGGVDSTVAAVYCIRQLEKSILHFCK
jgi:GMP synthase (glutamine-hydrolysing)